MFRSSRAPRRGEEIKEGKPKGERESMSLVAVFAFYKSHSSLSPTSRLQKSRLLGESSQIVHPADHGGASHQMKEHWPGFALASIRHGHNLLLEHLTLAELSSQAGKPTTT
jgi:hypothetical protein